MGGCSSHGLKMLGVLRMVSLGLPPLLLLLLLLSPCSPKEGSREGVNISYILNSFQIGYDRRVRPNYGGIPVTVGVTLYILSIGDLSEKYMDFTFDMYFRQFWTDPRLVFEGGKAGKEMFL